MISEGDVSQIAASNGKSSVFLHVSRQSDMGCTLNRLLLAFCFMRMLALRNQRLLTSNLATLIETFFALSPTSLDCAKPTRQSAAKRACRHEHNAHRPSIL